MREWWGTNLPPATRIVFYSGNGMSSGGDGVRLWNPTAVNADDVVDRVDFGESLRGHSFSYHPITGDFGIDSTNGLDGAVQAATADDVGSPGRTTGPTPLRILSEPASQIANPGDTVRFSVQVQGRPRGSVQWFFGDNPVPGATSTTLEVTDVQASRAGSYTARIANGFHSVTSAPAELVMQTEARSPAFTQTPSDLWMYEGQSAPLTAAGSGTPQPTLAWTRDGTPLSPAEPGQLILTGVTAADAGIYTVTARNPAGSATHTFRVHVTSKPHLVITEIMSSSSTNATGHADWWELTNLGSFPVSLKGYRFDDNSETLGSAFTFTNDVTIAPNESIIFSEGMTFSEFRDWWGVEYLPTTLQLLTYRGNGLSSAGDAVNVWNAAATDDADEVASAVFSTANAGVSFRLNLETGEFGELSQDGLEGAFTALSGGDVGSPGYVRDTPRVIPPRITSLQPQAAGSRLVWNSQPGARYAVQANTAPTPTGWLTLSTQTATGSSITVDLPAEPNAAARFFRIERLP